MIQNTTANITENKYARRRSTCTKREKKRFEALKKR